MLVGEGQNALDIGVDLVEARGTRRGPRMQHCNVKSERCCEHVGALPRLESANGFLEFLDHVSGGESAQVAALIFTIGMTLSDFRERLAMLQFRQRRFDSSARLFFALFLVYVLHD